MKSEIDKTIEEYDGYYEEIFKGFKEETGNIIVEFKDLNEYKQKTFIPILVSVNDCKNLNEFDIKLSLHKETSFEFLQNILNNFSIQKDKIKFLKYLEKKVKDLNDVIISVDPYPVNHDILELGFYDKQFYEYKFKDEKGQIFESFRDSKLIKDKEFNSSSFYSEIVYYCSCLNKIIKEIESETKELLKSKLKETLSEKKVEIYKSDIVWTGKGVDLLELTTALYKANAINNKTKNLDRNKAIEFFERIFNIELKDKESRLSKARGRKKSSTPFIDRLKKAFDLYIDDKDKLTPSKS